MNKELFNENIKKSIDALNNGEIILYPTDTVWGLGCDATNTKAVKKIFDLKKRNEAKSLIVIVNSDRMLQQFVEEVPELAWDIMDLSNKPTTIIYPNAKNLAENVVAHDGSIAIRMIKEGFCFHLLQQFKKPIVSTSANISGESTPSYYHDISPEIINKVAFVVNKNLDNGTHKASSLIKLGLNGEIQILRK